MNRHAAFRGDQVITYCNLCKKWHADIFQRYLSSSHVHVVIYQEIFLVDILYPLSVQFARNWGCVRDPFFYPNKVFNIFFIMNVFEEVQVFFKTLLKWL